MISYRESLFSIVCLACMISVHDLILGASQGKTTVLVTAVARIVYFTQSSFNAVVCCFGFTLWVGFTTYYQRDVLDRYLKVDNLY